MITLASHLSTFLREYLPRDRAASTHTCDTYAYSLMLLLRFAADHLSVPPSKIDLAQIDYRRLVTDQVAINDSLAVRVFEGPSPPCGECKAIKRRSRCWSVGRKASYSRYRRR